MSRWPADAAVRERKVCRDGIEFPSFRDVMRMHAFASGAAGAAALTALHETARQLIIDAPQMNVVGMRAVAVGLRAMDVAPPPRRRLYAIAMAGDLLANALYYAGIAAGRRPAVWTRALVLGLAAGAGAVLLPARLGLGQPPHAERRRTRALTVAWYLAGALAAAATARALDRRAAASGERQGRHLTIGVNLAVP